MVKRRSCSHSGAKEQYHFVKMYKHHLEWMADAYGNKVGTTVQLCGKCHQRKQALRLALKSDPNFIRTESDRFLSSSSSFNWPGITEEYGQVGARSQ